MADRQALLRFNFAKKKKGKEKIEEMKSPQSIEIENDSTEFDREDRVPHCTRTGLPFRD